MRLYRILVADPFDIKELELYICCYGIRTGLL